MPLFIAVYFTHMMNFYNNGYGMQQYITSPMWLTGFGGIMILLMAWSLFWKGLSLWHAGRKGQPGWFIALLLLNTLGILDIIYLFVILKLRAAKLFTK